MARVPSGLVCDAMGKKKGRSPQFGDTSARSARQTVLHVLSTRTSDSSPSVMLTADRERIVFNAGEGWQRLCVEQGVRVSKCDTMCLTHISSDAVGGLPGYLLTAADAGLKCLWLCGPAGLKDFLAATRHFMQRDNLTIEIDECVRIAPQSPQERMTHAQTE